MSDSTRLGLAALGGALLLGLAGDALLRAWPWGINVPLWWLLAVGLAALVARRAGLRLDGGGRWLLLPAIFCAAAVAWRDSALLVFLNVIGLATAGALAAANARESRLRQLGWLEYALQLTLAGFNVAGGPLVVAFADVSWREVPRRGWLPRTLAALRGTLVALPLLLVFGGLFVSADAAFAGIVANLFRIDLKELFLNLFFFFFWAWLSAGLLRLALIQHFRLPNLGALPLSVRLGGLELGIVVGSLDVLFALFVAVQFRYLFGGASLVEAATGSLSYAEYARGGFFELVTVAALVLPLLLVADGVRVRDNPARERLFRVLAGVLVGLLFVIMASAVQRMRLYQDEFGLTELRLYTTAFIAWLALVFVWFAATVLRGRGQRFAYGALVAGFVAIGALNVLNPDDLIVRVNLSRTASSRAFDGLYAASLSADAAPALVESLSALPEGQRQAVATRMLRWSPPQAPDWRSWNWGRNQAWQTVVAHEAELRALSAQPQTR
ncbi:MAG: DUF4153 domain-containing protein [Chloroflexota bacterium]